MTSGVLKYNYVYRLNDNDKQIIKAIKITKTDTELDTNKPIRIRFTEAKMIDVIDLF